MTRTTKTTTRTKKPTLGALAVEALTEALAFKAGKKTGATVHKVTARRAQAEPAPEFEAKQVARIRKTLGLSQPLFAQALNVSAGSVKAWEQGMNAPGGAALRLLEIVEAHPEVILERLRPHA